MKDKRTEGKNIIVKALGNCKVIKDMGGYVVQKSYKNKYGASIVSHEYSYGGKEGLWELAVLKNGELTYNTPITSDVIGWLEPKEVIKYCQQIEKL